jgi:hypothetical protein
MCAAPTGAPTQHCCETQQRDNTGSRKQNSAYTCRNHSLRRLIHPALANVPTAVVATEPAVAGATVWAGNEGGKRTHHTPVM